MKTFLTNVYDTFYYHYWLLHKYCLLNCEVSVKLIQFQYFYCEKVLILKSKTIRSSAITSCISQIGFSALTTKSDFRRVYCAKYDALCDLVAFVQFNKHEKHPWRSVNFSKVGCFSCFLNCTNATKSCNVS